MEEKIINYLKQFDFDIKKSKNARFLDQKVTPDVLSIVADCVLNYIDNNDVIEFTSTDIWRDEYSNENVIDIFGKTDVLNPKAKNEYDKFFQQPLKALSYARILR
ncbi:MAG TPA: restriction endonuclease, partial [Flavobacteriia bacterium]|nr:restriction endonuclease [Flavobacteriia bacterium]